MRSPNTFLTAHAEEWRASRRKYFIRTYSFLCFPAFAEIYSLREKYSDYSYHICQTYSIQMLLIQMTGLSGAGKSSIATIAKDTLTGLGYKVELLDGDDCRQKLCNDLGFSKEDRLENIRRLGFVGLMLAKHGVISILAVINPYEEAREALKNKSPLTKTVFIDCPFVLAKQRDTKGLYRKALLPPRIIRIILITSLVSATRMKYRIIPDLTIQTHTETMEQSAKRLTDFIIQTSVNKLMAFAGSKFQVCSL